MVINTPEQATGRDQQCGGQIAAPVEGEQCPGAHDAYYTHPAESPQMIAKYKVAQYSSGDELQIQPK